MNENSKSKTSIFFPKIEVKKINDVFDAAEIY